MSTSEPALVCRVATRLCALPLPAVAETMRALPIEPLPGGQGSVRGAAIIRGTPVPVIDLGEVLAGTPSTAARFITVHAGAHVAALAVDEVIGIRTLPNDPTTLPPLLREVKSEAVATLTILDADLVRVLQTARLVPPEVWNAVALLAR